MSRFQTMAEDMDSAILQQDIVPRISEFRRVIKVILSRGVVIFGLIIVAVLIIAAIFAPLIAPHDPFDQDMRAVLKSPSKTHLLS